MNVIDQILIETPSYWLIGCNKGSAYLFLQRDTGKSLFITCGDALDFKERMEELQAGFLKPTNNELLARLWSEYEGIPSGH